MIDGFPALARSLAAAGDPESDPDVLRLLIQASDDFAALATDARRRAFLGEPAPTGDPRLDALLAGLAVHLCRIADMDWTPAWTRDDGRYLPRIWWFGLPEGSRLQAYVFQRTPSCLRARGVMFNADELASV